MGAGIFLFRTEKVLLFISVGVIPPAFINKILLSMGALKDKSLKSLKNYLFTIIH